PKHPQYIDDLNWYVLQGEVFTNSAGDKSLGLLRFPAQPRFTSPFQEMLIVVSSAKSVRKIPRASKGSKRSTRGRVLSRRRAWELKREVDALRSTKDKEVGRVEILQDKMEKLMGMVNGLISK
ncbi:hypothetical protein FOZ62_013601, partial [Perkinsus olseni]